MPINIYYKVSKMAAYLPDNTVVSTLNLRLDCDTTHGINVTAQIYWNSWPASYYQRTNKCR